jgi:hypothetical protein
MIAVHCSAVHCYNLYTLVMCISRLPTLAVLVFRGCVSCSRLGGGTATVVAVCKPPQQPVMVAVAALGSGGNGAGVLPRGARL